MEKLVAIEEAYENFKYLKKHVSRLNAPVHQFVKVVNTEEDGSEECSVTIYSESGELLGKAFAISSLKEITMLVKPNGDFTLTNDYGGIAYFYC